MTASTAIAVLAQYVVSFLRQNFRRSCDCAPTIWFIAPRERLGVPQPHWWAFLLLFLGWCVFDGQVYRRNMRTKSPGLMEAELLPDVSEDIPDDRFLGLWVVFQRIQEQSNQLLIGGVGVFIHQGRKQIVWVHNCFLLSR
jgi:hypothetical protein